MTTNTKIKNKYDTLCVLTLLKTQGIVLYNALAILHSVLIILIPFGVGAFFNALIYQGKPFVIFSFLSCLAFAALLLNMLQKDMIQKIARRKEQDLQLQLFEAFQSLEPGATDGYKNGEVAMKFFRDANTVYTFLSNHYPMLLSASVSILFSIAMVLYKNSLLALLYLIFLLFMALALFPYIGYFRYLSHSIRSLYDKSMNGIFEFMQIFPFLKSLDAGDRYACIPRARFKSFRKMNQKNDRCSVVFESLNKCIVFLGEYSILGVAGYLAWKKSILIGDVVIFQILFLSVLNAFSGLFQLLPAFTLAAESISSMNELLKSEAVENIEYGEAIPSANGDISVKHVSFAYPNTERLIFSDFSCHIKGGSIIAVTGANGTGKTTLLRLITGYTQPQSGIIEIAGRNIAAWQKRSFRRKIASVFQDSLLLTGTIRDNITLRNKVYTEPDISEAIKLSGADTVIKRIPEGLEYRIGCDGGSLSGGERQKIAIARALIRKPDILIFDEVTNHLDYESRNNIKKLLISLKGNTTVFLVTHDPEIISLCDQIIELKK